VFLLLPKQQRALRIGTVIAGLATIAAYYVPTPVGSNVIRLPMLFAAPIAVAFSTIDRRWLAAIIAAICWWQPPLVQDDLGQAGDRAAQRWFYEPLIDELQRVGPVGRVEVVPLRDHWESTYVADAVPIARGWLRQVDVDRNGLFYGGLTPKTYREWLYDNAVDYVALPKQDKPNERELDFAGKAEAALIAANLSYLKRVWENGDWELYQVIGGSELVTFPGRLMSSSAMGIEFDVPVATRLLVRVRYSDWLVLKGPAGCVRPKGDWVEVELRRGGTYTLTSELGWPNRSDC
jgi:hypothetical protein